MRRNRSRTRSRNMYRIYIGNDDDSPPFLPPSHRIINMYHRIANIFRTPDREHNVDNYIDGRPSVQYVLTGQLAPGERYDPNIHRHGDTNIIARNMTNDYTNYYTDDDLGIQEGSLQRFRLFQSRQIRNRIRPPPPGYIQSGEPTEISCSGPECSICGDCVNVPDCIQCVRGHQIHYHCYVQLPTQHNQYRIACPICRSTEPFKYCDELISSGGRRSSLRYLFKHQRRHRRTHRRRSI
jgi:hypothetical protein